MSVWVKDLITKKIVYATHSAHFKNYYKKGRDILIQLAKETGITNNPYILPTWILVEKLIEVSIVSRESVENEKWTL